MIRKIIKDKSGVAMIEFALMLPIFVLAVMGGMELAWEAVVRQKLQSIAASSADNAARVRNVIDESDISEIMVAARLNGTDIDLEQNGRLIISSIQRNASNTGNWIRWQRCFGTRTARSNYGIEGTGQTNSSLARIGTSTIQPPTGNAIIIAEIEYRHEPLISNSFFGEKVFRFETVYIVRDRQDLSIGNVTQIPVQNQRRC